MLARAEPLASDLHHLSVAELVIQDPAADAVARLEDDDRSSARAQLARGDEAREARPDHDHVRFVRSGLVHGRTLSRPAGLQPRP
jgi:hypothetical protein